MNSRRIKNYGYHNFYMKEMTDIPTLEDHYEGIPSPPKEIENSFELSNFETLSNETNIKIFLFSEFTKRKFYLDCLIEKEGDTYIKSSDDEQSYLRKRFSSPKECFEDIADTFILPEERRYFRCKDIGTNKEFLQSIPKMNFNIYEIIKYNYNNNIEKLKNIISFPDNFCCYIRRAEDREFLKSQSKNMTQYKYEIILYLLSNLKTSDRMKAYKNSILQKIILLIDSCWPVFDNIFLDLYRSILDRYAIYLCDLLNITDINRIIKNEYKLENFPRFCFLPIEPSVAPYIDKRVNFKINPFNDTLNISINMVNTMETTDLIDYIYDTLLCSLYYYKQTHGEKYSKKEITKFANNIDFIGKHNKISDPKKYLNGLWIWDKKIIKQSTKSINNIINILNKNINQFENNNKYAQSDKDNEAKRRAYRRSYNAVRNSIEELRLYRIK